MVIGFSLSRWGFPAPQFWPAAERLIYFVLLPALLIERLATAQLQAPGLVPLTLGLLGTVATLSGVLWALGRGRRWDAKAFGAAYQGGVRFNTYLVLIFTEALLGAPGSALGAWLIALHMPLGNVLSVWVLHGKRPSWQTFATNPLIIACALGLGCNFSGLGLPWGSDRPLALLGSAALPLGLLAVGAGLRPALVAPRLEVLGSAVAVKLLLAPLIALGWAYYLELIPLEAAVLVLFWAQPTAPSAYILTRQLGGDAALMAAILTVQTALAALTLPAVGYALAATLGPDVIRASPFP
ncbi:MAG: AEC family transporter [Candidatus Competibacterales bacterium]